MFYTLSVILCILILASLLLYKFQGNAEAIRDIDIVAPFFAFSGYRLISSFIWYVVIDYIISGSFDGGFALL
jgi:hypothetical protein